MVRETVIEFSSSIWEMTPTFCYDFFKDINQEKITVELKEEIRTHDHAKLRHADVAEKNVLPKPEGLFCGSKSKLFIFCGA